MKQTTFFYIFLIIGSLGCRPGANSYPQKEYVVQAFDSIAKYSLHKNTFNFDSLENEVIKQISDSTPQNEIHSKLEYALRIIDKHSYIIRKEKWKQMREGKNPKVLMNPYPFKGEMLNDKYAYVSLDGFSGGDSLAANNYTDSLQNLILHLYSQDPAGWIIDLRYNSGGWSPSMISGLGPILGLGVKAYTISLDKTLTEHYYAKNDTEYITLSDSVWTFQKRLPTAVLIGKNTGSAGELLTLAFRGNPKTQLIGQPTYGVSTDLTPVFMPDSMQLVITSAVMTDRNKEGNGGPIEPNVLSNDSMDAFEKAYEWIDKN
jgi:hypothetical protein